MSIIIILVAAYFLFIHKFKNEDGNEQKGYEKLMEMLNKKSGSSANAGESQPFSSPTTKKENHSSKPNVSRPQSQSAANALTIGTIGPFSSGKTSLTAAITHVLAKEGLAQEKTYDDIDSDPEEKAMWRSIHVHTIEYSDGKNNFIHLDCPGASEYVNTMMSGARKMSGAILVASATDQDNEELPEQIRLARKANISRLIVFISKSEIALEDLVPFRKKIREMLSANGFDAESPIIEDSSIHALNDNSDLTELIAILSPYFTTGQLPEAYSYLKLDIPKDTVVMMFGLKSSDTDTISKIIAENANISMAEASNIVNNLPEGPQICLRTSDTELADKLLSELEDLAQVDKISSIPPNFGIEGHYVCALESLGSADEQEIEDILVKYAHISSSEAKEIIDSVKNTPGSYPTCLETKNADEINELWDALSNAGARPLTGRQTRTFKLSNK